jgi:hypothetical protein
MAPQGTNFALTTDIPDGEGDVLVFDCLDIESYRNGKADISLVQGQDGLSISCSSP